ncbi:MAG: FliA/WhiG family RNA polymerase sigma factor [Fretibacterium sp.]|nr:FliA/WhiG family RNA polymerase sigma factor [Fretibacterium sp.]
MSQEQAQGGGNADAKLWEEYRDDPTEACRERIVKRYLPLIKYVVGRMAVTPPPGLDYEDLLSFGVFGLLDAIDRFDLSKGFSFQTFAVPRIRGAVLDELRKCDWFSRTGREKVQRLNRAMEKVLRDKGHIRDEWVMEEMGVDERTYFEVQELASRSYVTSLDEVMPLEDGEVPLEATLADEREGAPERLEYESDMEQLVSAMKQLSEREQQVLSLYYYDGLSLKEIGKVLGVTESRISQIHGRALSALRAKLQAAMA